VSFDVALKISKKEPVTLCHITGFIAGCMAWHIHTGSIPIDIDSDIMKDFYVDVSELRFKAL
jgi:hypothetical protein